ncbi:MAG: hypothetical protein AAFP78_11465, partial [Pseudomonadota bacterium]
RLLRLSPVAMVRASVICFVFTALIFALAAGAAHRAYSEIKAEWTLFSAARTPMKTAQNDLVGALGYGGMIHEFKSFVIRGDQERYARTALKIGAALEALRHIEAIAADEQDIEAVEAIREVVNAYMSSLDDVLWAIRRGAPPEEIDGSVQVDDGPAIAGLNALRERYGAVSGEEGKAELLVRLRKTLGYGGMIHQFKDFVIRKDAPRTIKIVNDISEAEEILTRYEALGVSGAEKAALGAIAGVISSYRNKLDEIKRAVAAGADAKEIDGRAKVEDGPALTALETLNSELAADVSAAKQIVDGSLDAAENASFAIAVSVALAALIVIPLYAIAMMRGVARPTRLLEREAADRIARAKAEDGKRNDLQKRVAMVIAAAAEGDFDKRIGARYEIEALDSSADQIDALMERLAVSFGSVGDLFAKVAEGDLGARMHGFESGVFGSLQSNVNASLDRLAKLIADLLDTIAVVTALTDE